DPVEIDQRHVLGMEHGEGEVAVAFFFKHERRRDAAGPFGAASDQDLAKRGVVVLGVVGERLAEEHAVLAAEGGGLVVGIALQTSAAATAARAAFIVAAALR